MKKELTVKDLPNYGYGGYDYCDEWQSNGNLYTQVSRGDKSLHNFYADITKRKSMREVTIWLCLSASNSKDILIEKGIPFKTLKEARLFIVNTINQGNRGGLKYSFDELIKNHLEAKSKPVFTKNNDVLELIGTCYGDMGSEYSSSKNERWKEQYLYYHNDLPEYKHLKTYYSLGLDWKNQPSIMTLKPFSGGYSGGGVPDDTERNQIQSEMMELIGDNQKYKWLINHA